jgi:alpha-glucosidase
MDWIKTLASSVLLMTGTVHAVSWKELAYKSYAHQGETVIVKTSGDARLEVRAVAPDVLRIWLDPKGALQKKSSVSVLDEKKAGPIFKVKDEAEALRLFTSELELRIQKKPLRLDFYETRSGQWITGEKPDGGLGWRDDGAVFLENRLGSTEHIYGLGEDNDAFLGRLDRRGSRRDMWTGQEIRKGHVTADIPINFFMSTGNEGGGYGMFFDNSYRTVFDMGAADPAVWSWQAENGEALFYLIHGPDFPNILDRYTELTGRPSMPPLWALGFIQSKCCYWDWTEIDEVTREMTERQIPFDVMVIDYNWSKVPMDFQWADRWGDRIKEKLEDYEKQGRRFLLSNAGPMIRKEASNYQSALHLGLFAKDDQGHTVSCGHYGGDLLDFTNEKIQDWLWPQLKPLYDQGIDGWWLDLTEPEGEPPQTLYQEGPRALVHNKFSLLNTKAYYEMQSRAYPRDRVFILTRTGFAGIQRYGSAIWTGDTWSDYATFMAHVPEALNTTMSGIPYWTNDTGGFLQGLYKDNMEDHGRLYERWLQFSVYSPITRVHHVGPSAPYMFGPAVEASARHYINERYRLLPYIYSYSWEAYRSGSPLMRPLIFEYQNDPAVLNIKDQYLLGQNLLVAPVLTERSEQRRVYFPEGRWIDQDYGHEFEGGRSYCVAAPRSRIPVFLRSGAIIPKAPLMQHTGEKPWDPLTLELYPDGTSEFRLYQDDGETTDFAQEKAYTETMIRMALHDASIDLTLDESNKRFVPSRYQIRMHLTRHPRSVTVNGQRLEPLRLPELSRGPAWTWDDSNQVLSFVVQNHESLQHKIRVTLSDTVQARPKPTLSLNDCPDVPLPEPETQGSSQIPHFWPPPAMPGVVQAENYDKGGQGVAWSDGTPGNQGGVYRQDDVDITAAADEGGGYALTDLQNGEWLEYTVQAPKAGFYQLRMRYAAQDGNGAVQWERDGQDISALIELPITRGLWQDSSEAQVYLKKGEQILRLKVERGGIQLNAFRFETASHPTAPVALCSVYQGGFGDTFDCFASMSCRKINEDWEHNQDPAYWCIVHEL